jgi:DtxR family transcriptional regulator, Mn-dependent transcriptional regulator
MTRTTEHEDRYVLAAFRYSREDGTITVGGLADALGVAASSSSAMVKSLVLAGLLQRRDHGLVVTPEGALQGMYLLRRHRLVECLLADVLGIPLALVHEEADRWGGGSQRGGRRSARREAG